MQALGDCACEQELRRRARLQDDKGMLTASGDKTVNLWDTETAKLRLRFKGHHGSVRAVCTSARCPNTFVSGARDGAIMAWDMRSSEHVAAADGESVLRPVCAIQAGCRPAATAGALTTQEGRLLRHPPRVQEVHRTAAKTPKRRSAGNRVRPC